MKGAATRYPQIDHASAQLINLEGRIQQCRERRQQAAPLRYESDELLALTALVRMQSRGLLSGVEIDLQNRRNFERGRAFYYRRVVQMNLACADCHQDNWGKKLQRRFRSCLSGVRAEMLPYGAPEYLDLELYLGWRGGDLPVETPGVRR